MTVYRTKIPAEITVEKHYQELFGGDKMTKLRKKIKRQILFESLYLQDIAYQYICNYLDNLSAELEKLTVLGDEQLRQAVWGEWNAKHLRVAEAQLNHTKKEIRGLLE